MPSYSGFMRPVEVRRIIRGPGYGYICSWFRGRRWQAGSSPKLSFDRMGQKHQQRTLELKKALRSIDF